MIFTILNKKTLTYSLPHNTHVSLVVCYVLSLRHTNVQFMTLRQSLIQLCIQFLLDGSELKWHFQISLKKDIAIQKGEFMLSVLMCVTGPLA